MRVSAGIGAWVVGATTATALCLIAVPQLDAGTHAPRGSTLSPDQVRQALAAMTVAAPSATARDRTPTPVPTPTPRTGPATASPGGLPTAPVTTPAATAASSAPGNADTPTSRRLSTSDGAVTAECRGSTVYLTSWSPAPGYQVESVDRGPASSATVVLVSEGNRVTLSAACSDGVPALTVGDDSGSLDH